MRIWVHDTPDWRGVGSLFVQRGDGSAPSLRLRHTQRNTVYRFDAARETLDARPADVWTTGDPVADCDAQQAQGQLQTEADGRTLRANGASAEVEGRSILALALAPSASRLAVLSADGTPGVNYVPFLGSGRVAGTRWHQVFAWPSLERIQGPVALPIGGEKETLLPCWSPSEAFVLYPNIVFYRVAIVAVDST